MKFLKIFLSIVLCSATAIAAPVVNLYKGEHLVSNCDLSLTQKGSVCTITKDGKIYYYTTEKCQNYCYQTCQQVSTPNPEAAKSESRKDRVAQLVVSQMRNPFKLMKQSRKKSGCADQEGDLKIYG